MKILFLGGTGFLGPHTVQPALDRKHTVTLFNRGKTNPGLFPDVEKLHGDRRKDLGALKDREWDAVVDTSGYFPRDISTAMDVLGGHVKQYVFISSISVYASNSKPSMDETAAVGELKDPDIKQVTNESYGPLKAACEREAEKRMPGKVTNIRPGLIVGPGDPTDRFTYWPERIDRGGEILAPGNPDAPVQFIDARDLGSWIIQMIEDSHVGVFNAMGPKSKLSMAEMLYGIKAVTTADAQFTWVPDPFLLEHEVGPWMEMPLWIPSEGDSAGMNQMSNARATAVGLTFRPLADTARDTLEWANQQPKDRKRGAGLDPQKEAAVLKAWHDAKAIAPATTQSNQ
jgi:2'-hydroxyisoflavone reductase